ncbi:hypothetical protein CALCODRAFT_301188 [Calocera cornea HHB12733]|uniref:Uncharacterized protein n=1 Tax=Calocera cornea HHB12733 TaxID=1353952 RepID=A0A165FHY5_9BASI|nr:hypothetical protein CALCODRAFT_301188 [Calocera cornea HHB12733]
MYRVAWGRVCVDVCPGVVLGGESVIVLRCGGRVLVDGAEGGVSALWDCEEGESAEGLLYARLVVGGQVHEGSAGWGRRQEGARAGGGYRARGGGGGWVGLSCGECVWEGDRGPWTVDRGEGGVR